MLDTIDILASSYGWTADYIRGKVYPSEAKRYFKRIGVRQSNERLIDLAIAQNPWTKNPKKLAETLERQAKSGSDFYKKGDLDKAGMERLKNKLTKSKSIGVK